ncbi:metallophosphoesterase domain-containing protein 1 [Thecamonas trahens ATCC 50062]|uniref:Metallophosphoesterase domain-containing protein 1 n=1 Tax=Thecamonas trahens ATCC 50062 TaxID=461836 RepID=A0A0L0DRM3_THETB|nr:metallophosphoesterase domain-containing protein 1 [Thecamonas trahens ATCC 50062]KNC54984.1 metallophosphoesterase domain-containing protein 1 [Thecamonas trahens ATCC 50062]|eukprot:XP_013753429.1 metallophosphoesterase domain-containing protein 1 [Thecamonas trahens ATCC 50062]
MAATEDDGAWLIACISDTHGHHERLEAALAAAAELDGCTTVIHAGDAAVRGEWASEIKPFLGWLARLPFDDMIYVPGNHDLCMDAAAYEANWESWVAEHEAPEQVATDLVEVLAAADAAGAGLHVLVHGEQIEIAGGLTVAGLAAMPRQPKSRPQMAFGFPRGSPGLRHELGRLEPGADVLVTHTPPHGVLDSSSYDPRTAGKPFGCADLAKRVRALKPRLHVFGHIHSGAGVAATRKRLSVNAASCTTKGSEVDQELNSVLVVAVPRDRRRVPRLAASIDEAGVVKRVAEE